MKKVGITGGIGCGKSTVVKEFAKLDVPCFVADTVAAGYYYDAGFLLQIRDLFGDTVFHLDGSVDKHCIADIVFADRDMLLRLNALIHPRVMNDFECFCTQHIDKPYVLFESAILYDYGFDHLMDAIICVYLDFEERLRRLLKRDGGSIEALKARMANQLPAEEVLCRADYVILNYEGNPRQRQVGYFDNILRNEKLET